MDAPHRRQPAYGNQYRHVESSFVETVAWWRGDLTVRIKTGWGRVRVYVYHGVPEDVYRAMLAAPSKGVFYNANVKGRYART